MSAKGISQKNVGDLIVAEVSPHQIAGQPRV